MGYTAVNKGWIGRPSGNAGPEKESPMTQYGSSGVAKKIDIESISKDVAELANELGNRVEGPVDVRVLERMQKKIQKILTPKT